MREWNFPTLLLLSEITPGMREEFLDFPLFESILPVTSSRLSALNRRSCLEMQVRDPSRLFTVLLTHIIPSLLVV